MIGIIVAMPEERTEMEKLMESCTMIEYFGQKYFEGKIAGKDVVVAESGVGKVAAAVTVTRIMERYHCDCIINIGTAGGIKPYEQVADVVVVDKMTYHDWDEEAINGQARGFKNNQYVFESDPELVKLAEQIMSGFTEHKTHIGAIVSGDAFVSEESTVKMIQEKFPEAVACDMESASVGHVCSMYQVPCVIIRSLSDIVTNEGNHMDFWTYLKIASHRSAAFTAEFIARL